MASEEEQKEGDEKRTRVRLSRSGTPLDSKRDEPEEEQQVLEPVPVVDGEESWDRESVITVPPFLVYGVAVLLPLAGLWLVWSVAFRDEEHPPEAGFGEGDPKITTQGAREVAEMFLQAESIEQRLAWTYRAEEVRAHAPDYPAEVLAMPLEIGVLESLPPVTAMSQLSIIRFVVSMPSGQRRLLPVVATSEGQRVDWDAFARYGTASWQELRDGLVTEAAVRVFAKTSKYYNFSFQNEEQWVSYELSSPDWEESLTGYAKAGTSTAELMRRAARRPGNPGQRMILQLRAAPEGGVHRQWIVEQVVASGWVRAERDFETHWEEMQRLRQDGADPVP